MLLKKSITFQHLSVLFFFTSNYLFKIGINKLLKFYLIYQQRIGSGGFSNFDEFPGRRTAKKNNTTRSGKTFN